MTKTVPKPLHPTQYYSILLNTTQYYSILLNTKIASAIAEAIFDYFTLGLTKQIFVTILDNDTTISSIHLTAQYIVHRSVDIQCRANVF